MSIQRGSTYTLPFGSLTKAGDANTATVPTCVISKDAGAQVATTNAPTHNGNGEWKIVLTAAEMTAGTISGVAYGAGLVPSYFRIIAEADYTPTRAASLDNLNVSLSTVNQTANNTYNNTTTIVNKTNQLQFDGSGYVYSDVIAYWTGKSPAEQTLVTPTQKIATDASGGVTVGNYSTGKAPNDLILSPATNKLVVDASGAVVASNASAGGSTDWTATERNQIRFVLGLDGTKAQPVSGTATIQLIAAQTNKLTFDASNNVKAYTSGVTSTATVSGYTAGMGPQELVLRNPTYKLNTDASGNIVMSNVTIAPTGLDLVTFDGLKLTDHIRGISAVSMGTITYDTATQTGTVSSATNPAIIKIQFKGDPEFTTREIVALTLGA